MTKLRLSVRKEPVYKLSAIQAQPVDAGGSNLQTKALTITSNGTVSVTSDAPYDALKKVDVTVDVASGGPSGPYIEYTSLDSFGRVFTAKFRGTIVPEHAFSYLAELTSVDMPDNVIAIGDNGFYRCPKLSLTSLPSGITSLGDYAFADCSMLTLTSLPSGITSLGDYVFRDCPRLALTTFPSGITAIGEYAFRNCTSLASITLPPPHSLQSEIMHLPIVLD